MNTGTCICSQWHANTNVSENPSVFTHVYIHCTPTCGTLHRGWLSLVAHYFICLALQTVGMNSPVCHCDSGTGKVLCKTNLMCKCPAGVGAAVPPARCSEIREPDIWTLSILDGPYLHIPSPKFVVETALEDRPGSLHPCDSPGGLTKDQG